MFGSEMLEIAIGLAFLFLILSLFATGAREQLEAVFKTRAVHLERGIRLLLADHDGAGITQEIYRHPLIFGLFEGEQRPGVINAFLPDRPAGVAVPAAAGGGGLWSRIARFLPQPDFVNPRRIGSNLPSYIPSRNFAMALLDLANGNASDGRLDLGAVRATAATLKNEQVSRALVIAAAEAKGDIDRARASLEAWFDGGMDRVAGWYKRESQWILLALGFVLAAILNIDALHVASELSANTTLRRQVVAEVEATQHSLALPDSDPRSKNVREEVDGLKTKLGSLDRVVGWGIPGRLAAVDLDNRKARIRHEVALMPAGQVTAEREAQVRKDWVQLSTGARAEVRTEAAELRRQRLFDPSRRAALVERWHDLPTSDALWWEHALPAVFGWIVTALAISLGAPFWFDLLNKFMVIRSTVKPFEKSPAEGSEDRRGGVPAANALEPAPGTAHGTDAAVAAAAAGAPAVMPTQRVTLRIAVDDFDEFTPGSLRVSINGAAVSDTDDELIELPLAVGVVQRIVVNAEREGREVTWNEELTPTLEDEARPLAIALG